ncbi:unnamed protein product [Urochloa humidicola]
MAASCQAPKRPRVVPGAASSACQAAERRAVQPTPDPRAPSPRRILLNLICSSPASRLGATFSLPPFRTQLVAPNPVTAARSLGMAPIAFRISRAAAARRRLRLMQGAVTS